MGRGRVHAHVGRSVHGTHVVVSVSRHPARGGLNARVHRRESDVQRGIDLRRRPVVRAHWLRLGHRHVASPETASDGRESDERERQQEREALHGRYPLSTFNSEFLSVKIGVVVPSSATMRATFTECAKSSPNASGMPTRDRNWYCTPISVVAPRE